MKARLTREIRRPKRAKIGRKLDCLASRFDKVVRVQENLMLNPGYSDLSKKRLRSLRARRSKPKVTDDASIALSAWPVARDGRPFGFLLWKLRIALAESKANSYAKRLAKPHQQFFF